jgi:hypothetical protein
LLTEARATTPWLREGFSVPQQQIIRDFGKSRAKAIKDIKDRVPMKRRAGMPKSTMSASPARGDRRRPRPCQVHHLPHPAHRARPTRRGKATSLNKLYMS